MASKLLGLGNPKKIVDHLRAIVDATAIAAIEAEADRQVVKLYDLAMLHYRFARGLPSRDWRHRVSRLYYSAYGASRSMRLKVHGHFSTEVKDHQKVNDLPDDFPNKARFSNKLDVLRDDRNTCDYDQASRLSDLFIPPVEATELVRDYLLETKQYLRSRGVIVRGRP